MIAYNRHIFYIKSETEETMLEQIKTICKDFQENDYQFLKENPHLGKIYFFLHWEALMHME